MPEHIIVLTHILSIDYEYLANCFVSDKLADIDNYDAKKTRRTPGQLITRVFPGIQAGQNYCRRRSGLVSVI